MRLEAGVTLLSLSTSPDDYFYDAQVLLVEYNQDGALGFVVNRPFSRRLDELVEFAHLPSFPLYEGGPADQEHLYIVHCRPDKIQGGAEAGAGIFYGGDFAQAAAGIQNGTLILADIRIFIGYCGWHTGDLERELEEGGWQLTDTHLFM